MNTFTNITMNCMPVGQGYSIQASNVQISFSKTPASSLSTTEYLSGGYIQTPSPCLMLTNIRPDCSDIIMKRVIFLGYHSKYIIINNFLCRQVC